jgi:cytochrome c
MRGQGLALLAAAAGAIATSALAQAPGNVAAGRALYEAKCGGCHSVEENRVGPRHRNVVGRKVASLKDYDYSPALKTLGGVWTPERIDRWLQGPQAMAPGTKMFFSVPDADQRRKITAYLASVSRPAN